MTALDEERCRILVGKLCSGLGWIVHPAPAVRYVLLDRKGRSLLRIEAAGEESFRPACEAAEAKAAEFEYRW